MPHSGEGYGRIVDILEAIDKIASFTNGLDEASFFSNPLVRDAVVWNLTVIGEAAGAVPASVRDAHPDVPWARMRGLRNLLVHEYFGIDDEIIWSTVTNNILPLAEALREILP